MNIVIIATRYPFHSNPIFIPIPTLIRSHFPTPGEGPAVKQDQGISRTPRAPPPACSRPAAGTPRTGRRSTWRTVAAYHGCVCNPQGGIQRALCEYFHLSCTVGLWLTAVRENTSGTALFIWEETISWAGDRVTFIQMAGMYRPPESWWKNTYP